MICLVVDGHIVAIGPDWMEHHFLEDAAELFPGKSISIFKEPKE